MKSENGIDDNQDSNSCIYMDMKVYFEEDESDYNEEIKEDEENDEKVENRLRKENEEEKKEKAEKDLKEKDNFLNDKVKSQVQRYVLRARNQSKKVIGIRKKTKANSKYKCSKCSCLFGSKSEFQIHKSEMLNFKCLQCKKNYCSEELLNKHVQECEGKLGRANKNKRNLKFKKCSECFSVKQKLESHLINHDAVSFKCDQCKRIFTDKSKLEFHIIRNRCKASRTFTCDICKRTFTCFNTLRTHITSHLNNNPLQCQICFIIFENLESLQKHVCRSQINESKSCDLCNSSFLQSSRSKMHLLHHREENFNCLTCYDYFNSQGSLDIHEKNGHCDFKKLNKCEESFQKDTIHINTSQGNEEKKCKTCNKVFKNLLELSEHICKIPRKLKYECDTCGSKFTELVKLKIHILNKHHGIIYQCDNCNTKFLSQEDRDAHIEKQDCKSEDPCTCKVCGKVFAKKDYLKKHQYMHMNILFKCKYCYCTFMKEKSYKKHMEKMNCSKSARKIKMNSYNYKKCRICEIEYESEETLIEHFRSAHPGEEPHQCFCCDSCLPTFRDLETHIHHHNIQKFTCNLCGKPYTSQEGFRKHKLKHTGAKFKCKFCNSQFLNERRFNFHEKTCKKNPESEYYSQNTTKKKDDRPKQSRQLHWESRIIIKHSRGDPNSVGSQVDSGQNVKSIASTFFNEPEVESTNERGWFDNYYKTEEDDIAFGLKNNNETNSQESESYFDVSEFLQTVPSTKKNRSTSPPSPINTSPIDEVSHNTDNYSETDSNESTSDSSDEEVEDVDLPIDYNPKKCRICTIVFDQEYELLHHFIKSHPGQHAHKCPSCSTYSPLFAQLKEHMKVHGIGIGIFNCDNCSKKFKSEKKMKSHNIRCKGLNIDDKGENFQLGEERCKRCDKKFYTKFRYKRHKQICKAKRKKNNFSEKVSLDKPKDLSSEHFLEEDIQSVSDDNESPKESNNEVELQNNQINEKLEDKKIQKETPVEEGKKFVDLHPGEPPLDSFPCRLCDKKFQYERGIVMHFKSVHPGHKPLICHVCNVHLADKLKEHLKTHGIGDEFICELCGKRFNQKFLSKIHEMWHQGIEYKCKNCKQKFLNKEKMDKHIKENRCSNRQSLMRLPCDICGKAYRSKFGLSKHYITHTPKELRPVKNKMNCEFCGKWFENNNGLQRHRRIHTGERPFCCRYCPKAFAQEGNCKAHERIHTGETKPRKKKFSDIQLPPPQPVVIAPPTLQPVESVTYPTQINLYIFNNIDPNGTVH